MLDVLVHRTILSRSESVSSFGSAMPDRLILCVLALFAATGLTTPGPSPQPIAGSMDLPKEVADGLRMAKKVVGKSGDRLWPGYGSAPFGFLFVAPDSEILICDERLPAGFVRLQPNWTLRCQQARGPRTWRQANLLAAMPAFGRPSVIVMGSSESTGKSTADWTTTIFHEHFHQWQAELPEFYARISELDLAEGDRTGMWMLNYPFPYASENVGAAFAGAANALGAAISADAKSFGRKRQAYLTARAALLRSLSDKEGRYLEFQLWQEGVARWSEIEVAARSGEPSLVSVARSRQVEILTELSTSNLAVQRRVAFYAFGAAEAMLLQRSNPNWRACYMLELSMGPLHSPKCRK